MPYVTDVVLSWSVRWPWEVSSSDRGWSLEDGAARAYPHSM